MNVKERIKKINCALLSVKADFPKEALFNDILAVTPALIKLSSNSSYISFPLSLQIYYIFCSSLFLLAKNYPGSFILFYVLKSFRLLRFW